MGIKVRVFVCIESYKDKSIYKGQILDVMGSWFRMRGFNHTSISSYRTLSYGVHKWKEITNDSQLLDKIKSKGLYESFQYHPDFK